jgi:hypothetical protein
MQGKSLFQSGKRVPLRGAAAASLFAAALTGCATSAPLFTSDGRPTTAVQCSAAGPWENCTDHARGICQGDIDVLSQSTADGVNKLLFACKAK